MEKKKKGFFTMIKESLNKTGGCCGGDGCCGPTKEDDKKNTSKEKAQPSDKK